MAKKHNPSGPAAWTCLACCGLAPVAACTAEATGNGWAMVGAVTLAALSLYLMRKASR